MAAPRWAQDLVLQVWLDEGRDELPEIVWRRGGWRRILSAGNTWHDGQRITITAAPGNRIDQKLVLLHELAHVLTPGAHHGPGFWDKAWQLYRRYKVPIRYALRREQGYRKEAAVAYRRNRKEQPDGSA